MLLGKHAMATIWLYCRDAERSKAFYRDVLGLPLFDEHGGTAHFDGGGIRLSLHPAREEELPPQGSFLVFEIPKGIDRVYEELARRGVKFKDPLEEAEFGQVAGFLDPDGHQVFIWQPPGPDDPRYPMVAPLVRHYESVVSRLSTER